MRIKIIVDSTADMTAAVAEKVKIVPLTVHFGDQEFVSGVDIQPAQFYELLARSEVLPTTSQPTPFAFEEAFRKTVEDGYEVICLTCSGRLSGTFQSANIAAQDFPGKVHVVDSNTIAIGLGILAEYAVGLAEQGLDTGTILERIMKKREKVRLLALVDTLEYLKKGGRISSAVAVAGGLLNIKPVITLSGGEIRVLGKARGTRQGYHLLDQEVQKAGGIDFSMPLMAGYTGSSDAGLQTYLQVSALHWEDHARKTPVSVVGSVVGTHVGPGAVAAAFFAAE